ncbi:MAG: trypsin-like peptidase domain-containing protein [Williamsia sp.]|nr:trypsin-like peptidase domain-containing protein [Williamsia sp.]
MKHIYNLMLILSALALSLMHTATGQVKTKIFQDEIPLTLLPQRQQNATLRIIKAPAEFEKLKAIESSKGNPQQQYDNRFAYPVNVTLDLIGMGKVIEEKNTVVYLLTLQAENAFNISVQFNEFRLSPNAILSIYTRHELTDSITSKENNKNNVWATRIYQGSELTLALRIPQNEKNLCRLKIDKVNFGFRRVGGEYFGQPGQSADCNINVVCPAGTGWENERNTVALIVANGSELCTGSLIMNTCGNNIPYLLTANHCLSGGNVPNWVFQFQSWSTTCVGNNGWREDLQFNGCTLRANSAATDFALLELNTTPPVNSNFWYAGWNRSNAAPNSAVSIHHPKGDLMKISVDSDPLVTVSWLGGAVNHWRATFNQGIVQPGSSGAPLFGPDHRVVGQLHGYQLNACPTYDNPCFCTQDPIGEYGRFDLSWDGGGTPATRLSDWLDPTSSGAFTTNTTSRNDLVGSTLALSISGGNTLCGQTGNFTLNGAPVGSTIIWETTNHSIATVAGNGTTGVVTRVGNGVVTLTATVQANCFPGNNSTSITLTAGTYTISNMIPYMNQCIGGSDWELGLEAKSSLPAQPGLQYIWTYNGIDQAPTYSNMFYTYEFPASCLYIGVRAINACGATPTLTNYYCPPCGSFRAIVAPNPVRESFTLTLEPVTAGPKTPESNQPVIVSLYDIHSQILYRQWKINGNIKTHNLNVKGIRRGNYVLEIKNGKASVTKQIVIE